MNQLLIEIPDKDLEGSKVVLTKRYTADVDAEKEVDESFIANRRYQLKRTYFIYKRKRTRWLSLHKQVMSIVE